MGGTEKNLQLAESIFKLNPRREFFVDNKINMLVRHFFIAGKFGVNMWRSIKNFFSKSNDYMEIVPKWLMIGPIFFLDYIGLFVKCTFSNLPAFLRALIEFSLFASPTILVAFLFRTFEKKRGNFSGKTEGEEGTFFAGVPKWLWPLPFILTPWLDTYLVHYYPDLFWVIRAIFLIVVLYLMAFISAIICKIILQIKTDVRKK